MLMDGQVPQGAPAEGAELHLQSLMEYTQSDEFGLFPPQYIPTLLQPYMQRISQQAMMEAQQAQIMAAAQAFGQQASPNGQPGPQGQPQPGVQDRPQIQGAELLDESLPGAGGGGNAMVAA